MDNAAHSRIKTNKLLEKAGWRFFDNVQKKVKSLIVGSEIGITHVAKEIADIIGREINQTRRDFYTNCLRKEAKHN